MLIPHPDAVTAAVEAQASHLTPIGWRHISDDATHHNILDGLTIRARHSRDLLTEGVAHIDNPCTREKQLTNLFNSCMRDSDN